MARGDAAAPSGPACGCSVRLSVSLPITESSVGRPIAASPGDTRAVERASRCRPARRRARAARAMPRVAVGEQLGSRRSPCAGDAGRRQHGVDDDVDGARRSRSTIVRPPRWRRTEPPRRATRSTTPGVDQREQLRGVDRRRPERDPLQLGGEPVERAASRPRRGRRRRGARRSPGRAPARRARAPSPVPAPAPAPTATSRSSSSTAPARHDRGRPAHAASSHRRAVVAGVLVRPASRAPRCGRRREDRDDRRGGVRRLRERRAAPRSPARRSPRAPRTRGERAGRLREHRPARARERQDQRRRRPAPGDVAQPVRMVERLERAAAALGQRQRGVDERQREAADRDRAPGGTRARRAAARPGTPPDERRGVQPRRRRGGGPVASSTSS